MPHNNEINLHSINFNSYGINPIVCNDNNIIVREINNIIIRTIATAIKETANRIKSLVGRVTTFIYESITVNPKFHTKSTTTNFYINPSVSESNDEETGSRINALLGETYYEGSKSKVETNHYYQEIQLES